MIRLIDRDMNRVGEWVAMNTQGTWTPQDSTAIGLERNGDLVAGTIFTNWNGRSLCMHTSINWMSRKFLWCCFHYPFIQLKAAKVIGLVDSCNAKAMRLNRHLGFVEEATVSGAGKQGDLVLFTMTKDQCRWLALGDRDHGWQRRKCA